MSNLHPSDEFEDLLRKAVHESDARPEFVSRMRNELAKMPPRSKPRLVFKPAWVVGIALAVLVVITSLPGVDSAYKQLFSFIPGIGLVAQKDHLRILQTPVTVTRDGISITIEQVVVDENNVELAYSVSGIASNLQQPAPEQGGQMNSLCSGQDMYPNLLLQDGTLLVSDPIPLGGKWLSDGYIAGHSFAATISASETQLTFQLKCLQDARRGAAPEDWSIPFALATAPEGYVAGEPVYETDQAVMSQSVESEINFSIEGVVPQEDGIHVFFRIMTDADPSTYLAISPGAMYAINAEGTMIDLINVLPWSPFDMVDIWEYRTATMPADGPMTIVFENAQIFYLAQDLVFEFTPGAGAQVGQTWLINEEFEIKGYELTVESARMIELEGHPGFEFTIVSSSEDVSFTAELLDMTSGEMWSTTRESQPAQAITSGFVYKSKLPETIRVAFNTIAIQIDGVWQASWTPPAQ
jgi:hypothetical protein